MKIYSDIYNSIISPENILEAWNTFKYDKRKKPDVAWFAREVEKHIFQLYRDLYSQRYKHGPYRAFWIRDPKLRHIFKATVRDRVLHHAVFAVLNPIFEETFIPTSFSCRIGKGTHRGMRYLRDTVRKVSANYTRPCFVLKCDIRKFFNTVDHHILIRILEKRITDEKARRLLREIIGSYEQGVCERERERESTSGAMRQKGIPIGNLTSQLFANIYMDVLDQFVKHELKVKYYARYTDDFVIVADNAECLKRLLPLIRSFLKDRLLLDLHPKKVEIKRCTSGVDFLGYIVLPYHTSVRTKTIRRMMRKLREQIARFKNHHLTKARLYGSLRSYLGVLSHADAYHLKQNVLNKFWFWLQE